MKFNPYKKENEKSLSHDDGGGGGGGVAPTDFG